MSNLTALETSQASPIDRKKDLHTISLLVRDSPGVLVRVAMVFSRRGYNIESLVVSPGAQAGFSRMTVTCSGDPGILEQMIKQLTKLVDVVHALDHTLSDRFEYRAVDQKPVVRVDVPGARFEYDTCVGVDG